MVRQATLTLVSVVSSHVRSRVITNVLDFRVELLAAGGFAQSQLINIHIAGTHLLLLHSSRNVMGQIPDHHCLHLGELELLWRLHILDSGEVNTFKEFMANEIIEIVSSASLLRFDNKELPDQVLGNYWDCFWHLVDALLDFFESA